jgi:hypothetical protein
MARADSTLGAVTFCHCEYGGFANCFVACEERLLDLRS